MRKIKEIRKKHKISQEMLAERFSVERATISRWENSINDPPISVLIELSRMFNVSIDYLLGNEHNEYLEFSKSQQNSDIYLNGNLVEEYQKLSREDKTLINFILARNKIKKNINSYK